MSCCQCILRAFWQKESVRGIADNLYQQGRDFDLESTQLKRMMTAKIGRKKMDTTEAAAPNSIFAMFLNVNDKQREAYQRWATRFNC